MKLGRVVGTLVASIKYKGLEGVKFLIVQPVDKHLEPKGQPFVAADGTAMAGPGELIYYEESREAAQWQKEANRLNELMEASAPPRLEQAPPAD